MLYRSLITASDPSVTVVFRSLSDFMTSRSLRTLASTGDGGPEDAPEEPTSGSHRLVSPAPGEETTLTLLEESEEVIPTCSKKNYRLKGRWVARKVRGRSRKGAK
ncbi:hypothetical protein BHE74_00058543 [Ensete ventricosum]|nr:hypothetical protein BHE74_00058543 [Ensete ventricosum]